MEVVKAFAKSYFVFLLMLQVVTYLTPKEQYRKYVQFFTGALMAVLLLRPVLTFFGGDGGLPGYADVAEVMERLDGICYEGEEENLFELFFPDEYQE